MTCSAILDLTWADSSIPFMPLFNHIQSILPRLLDSCAIGGIREEVAAKCPYDEASYTLHKRQQAKAPEKHITLEKGFGEARQDRSTRIRFESRTSCASCAFYMLNLLPSHYLLLSTSQAVVARQAQKSWWPYTAQPGKVHQGELCLKRTMARHHSKGPSKLAHAQ